MKPCFPAFAAALSLIAPFSSARELEIDAGDLPREQSIVKMMAGAKPREGALRTSSGGVIPCQTGEDGVMTFIAPKLEAGQKVTLRETAAAGLKGNIANAVREGDQILLSVEGAAAATYQMAAKKAPRPGLDPLFLRGGYLHPLVTPSGKVVTDDYAANHLHHHGVWMAWTKTVVDGRETDFWNMGQGKGKVDFVSLDDTWSGPVEAGLIAKHKYTDLTSGAPVDVLGDTWMVKTYAVGNAYRMIDLESSQVALDGKTLELPIYHYGGIGIRGLEAWNGKGDAAKFITSEGVTDRIKANSQPARWLRMTGKVEGGGVAGIAILSHPDNFRAPQPVRIHPNEPFISFSPQTNAAMAIKPGETYRMKYRFIVSDGEADAGLLERLWQDYAKPVAAKWVE